MSGVPNPTRDQMDRALDLHGGDVDRATAYLCKWLGVAHPAAYPILRRKVADRKGHPHD